jgi:asparagine synthase (glutamine-hydrolysing)
MASWLVEEFETLRKVGRDVVQAALALDRITYLPGDLLFKVDACSMLHALEVRSPFMDHELVAFAASLSTKELLGAQADAATFKETPMRTSGKRLLRKAFAGDLPPAVFKRRKSGFAVPIGEWFRRGNLREMLNDVLGSGRGFAATHLNMQAVRKLIEEHQKREADHAQRLYALLMLELWHRA